MGAWACAGDPQGPSAEPLGTPPADRESWDVLLEIADPGLRVQVRAPYLQDQVERQVSRADSGAQVAFCDSAWQPYSTLGGQRLVLDYKTNQASLAGQVQLQAPDGLVLESDSLVWDQQKGSLRAPGQVRLRAPSGGEEARRMQTGSKLSAWSAEEVHGHWQVRGDAGARVVQIRARHERGEHRQGKVYLDYDSAQVEWEEVQIRSPRAWFDEAKASMGFAGGVEATDADRRLAARELECDLADRMTTARGSVEVHGPSLLVQAEELREDRSKRRWQAQGQPAVWQREERLVAARRLEYAEAEEAVAAGGEVVFRGDGRTLRADTLRYEYGRQHLMAGGSVSLQAAEFEGVATGTELVYDLEAEQARLNGSPQWRRPRALSEPLLVKATELRFDLRAEQVVGDRFELQAAGLRVQAGRGAYERGAQRLELSGQVELHQEREGSTCQLLADSLTVVLRDGKVAQTEWPGQVEGTTASARGQRAWLRAGSGRARLEDERLQQLELGDQAEVTQQDPDGEGASRFRGRRMVVEFAADGGLDRVAVEGGAELWSHLPATPGGEKPAGNHVRGERLEIRFAGGKLVEVRVAKAIEGSYFPPPDETR